MKKITSRDNPLYKRIRIALDRHEREIVVEGPKQVATALANGWTPLLLVSREGEAGYDESAHPKSIKVSLSPSLFDSLAGTSTSQGALALFERKESSLAQLLDLEEPFLLALDAVQDPGNLGTIVRTAAAFEVDGIILLPGCADPFSSKAIRASAGAVLEMKIATCQAEELASSGLRLYAADSRGSPLDPPSSNAVLILGSEGQGVSEELLHMATLIRIDTSQRVESLNVAIAGGILLWRVFQSRGRHDR